MERCSGLPLPKYAARVAARLHIWTAAPAPPRLFLPQAAAQLRSQQQLPVSSAGRGRCVCLLRLAGFCGAPRRALAKIGALLRVAVSQIYGAGRGLLVYLDGCPCSASAVSAAGSASAAQPASPRCFCRRQRSAQLPPFGGNLPQTAPSSFSFAGTFRPALCGCCAACTQEEQSVARAPPGRARRAGGPLTGGGRDSIKTKTEQFVAKESSLQP